MKNLMLSLTWVLGISISVVCTARPAASGEDLSYATDPVSKMSELTTRVSKRAKELESVANQLDQVSDELDRVEKLPAKALSPAKFAELEKRFKAAVKRSEEVENQVKAELDGTLVDIGKVKQTLNCIAEERKQNKKTISPGLSDEELKECQKNILELEKSAKELKAVVTDQDQSETSTTAAPKSKPAAPAKSNKPLQKSRGK